MILPKGCPIYRYHDVEGWSSFITEKSAILDPLDVIQAPLRKLHIKYGPVTYYKLPPNAWPWIIMAVLKDESQTRPFDMKPDMEPLPRKKQPSHHGCSCSDPNCSYRHG